MATTCIIVLDYYTCGLQKHKDKNKKPNKKQYPTVIHPVHFKQIHIVSLKNETFTLQVLTGKESVGPYKFNFTL